MRIVSGIQPTGRLHLGNYVGSVRPMLGLQAQGHECLFFVADLHALTSSRDPGALRTNRAELVRSLLALGVDPDRTIFFRQSDVPQVPSLCWILTTITPMGILQRAHAYKDRLARGETPEHGLFAYPVLQAADILIYRAGGVPVGPDQRQHVEIAQDIQERFARHYGPAILVRPEPIVGGPIAGIPGIDGRKMSKSHRNTLDLFGPREEIGQRIRAIVTDPTPISAPKDPERSIPLALLEQLAEPEEALAWRARYAKGGLGYREVKDRLQELFLDTFGPARERYAQSADQKVEVEDLLAEGARRARLLAEETLAAVRIACGLDAEERSSPRLSWRRPGPG